MNRFYIEKDLSTKAKFLDCIHDLDSVSRMVGEPQKEALLDWGKCWGGFMCNDGRDFIREKEHGRS